MAEERSNRAPCSSGDLTAGMLRRGEQHLLALSRQVGYGTLANIGVCDGELMFTATRARRKYRLGKPDVGRHTQPVASNFKLKAQHRDLIDRLRRIRNGVIVSLEVQDGLPVDMLVEEDVVV